MTKTQVSPYIIESQDEADDYLTALSGRSEYRSMYEVELRAKRFIQDSGLRVYFVETARAMGFRPDSLASP